MPLQQGKAIQKVLSTNSPIRYASKLGGLFLLLYLGEGIFLSQLLKIVPFYWIYDFFGLLIFPVCAYLYLIRKGIFSKRDFGWQPLRKSFYSAKDLIFDTLILLFIWFVCFAVLYRLLLSSALSEYLSAPVLGSVRPSSGIGWFVVGIYWCIQPALIEESFFRGFMKSFFDAVPLGSHRTFLYATVSGLLFGIGHLPQGGGTVLVASILGFAFCFQYVRIKHAGPFVVVHFVGNFYSLFLQ